MKIYIPTKGRTGKQHTIRMLPKQIQDKLTIVCPSDETEFFKETYPHIEVVTEPDGITNIGAKKQWILENCPEQYCLMIDDDIPNIRIRKDRINLDQYKMRNAVEEEFVELFDDIERWVKHFPLLGLTPQGGSNRFIDPHTAPNAFHKRIYTFYAIDCHVFRKEGIRFDEMPLMEDMNASLHLLKRGYMTALITDRAWTNSATQTPGGCMTYRTSELQAKCAKKLVRLHAPHVKLRTVKCKSSWQGGGMSERLDVTVQWMRSYLSSGKTIDYEEFKKLLV